MHFFKYFTQLNNTTNFGCIIHRVTSQHDLHFVGQYVVLHVVKSQ